MHAQPQHRPWLGISAMLIGLILLVASDSIAKLLVEKYPVSQIIGVRATLVVAVIVLVALLRGKTAQLRPRRARSHLVRGVFAVLSSYLFVLGLSKVSLISASAAAYTGPLFLTAMAPLLLGERVGRFRWSAVVIGFCGALIMLRPSASGIDWPLLLPAAAAFCGALRDLVTRRISISENSICILMTTNAMLAITGLMLTTGSWAPFVAKDVVLVVASALLIAVAHFLHIEAFRYAEAATLAPYRYTSIIWATLLALLIWGDYPSVNVVVGGAIVIASGLAIFYRERHRAR